MTKQLIFVGADDCQLSKELQPTVELFKSINPDVEVIELSPGGGEKAFNDLTGSSFQRTPTFVGLIDGVVVDRHEGRLCEVRLGKMFTGGDSEN